MSYCNPLTNLIYNEIAQAMLIPFFNEDRLLNKIKRLDYEAICAIDNKGSTLLHNTLTLAIKTPATCCIILKLLVQKAIQIDIGYIQTNSRSSRKNASEFLLTQQNAQDQSPYYQALLMHADPSIVQTCAQWLSFSLDNNYISVKQYLSTHQNPRNLAQLMSGGYASELKTYLEELDDAKKHQRISHQQYQQLFLSRDSTKTQLLEVACKSECRETFSLLLIWFIIDYHALLKKNHLGNTLIHSLIDDRKDNQAKAVLFAVCDAIDDGTFPSSVIETILLCPNDSGFRLLDKALKTGNYKSIELVVNIAELAFKKQWIHANQYNPILINHVNYDLGFSPLHEILILKAVDIECMLLYINEVLKGVLNEIISLEQFRALLTQLNKAGYPPIHQAINNASFEKTHLFLNLFKWIFSQYDYDVAILSHFHKSKETLRSSESPDSEKIGEFVSNEQKDASKRLHQTVDVLLTPLSPTFTLVKSSPWSANFINFISLINQVLCFEKSKYGDTTSFYEEVDVVMSITGRKLPYSWRDNCLFFSAHTQTLEPQPLIAAQEQFY